MKLSDPIESIIDEIRADFVAVRPIVVDRTSPRSSVSVRKVGTELAQIISFRSKVVIHYIQYDGDPLFMSGVEEGFKTFRPSIRGLDCIGIHAVVSPVARAGKLDDRHEFDCRDAHVVL